MKLSDFKIEVYYEESNGYLSLRWNVYNSETGESPKLDKGLLRYVASVLAQASQQVVMQNEINELINWKHFSPEKVIWMAWA